MEKDNFRINRKFINLEISAIPIETKNEICPHGTSTTQNFIHETSVVLYSITFYKLFISKESDGSMKSFKSVTVESYIHSYSFALWWVKMTKRYLYSFVTFTRNDVCGTHLVFSKEEISRFHIWTFENVCLLGEKFTFFNSLGTTKMSTIFKLSEMLPFSLTFSDNLNYASTLNIRKDKVL